MYVSSNCWHSRNALGEESTQFVRDAFRLTAAIAVPCRRMPEPGELDACSMGQGLFEGINRTFQVRRALAPAEQKRLGADQPKRSCVSLISVTNRKSLCSVEASVRIGA